MMTIYAIQTIKLCALLGRIALLQTVDVEYMSAAEQNRSKRLRLLALDGSATLVAPIKMSTKSKTDGDTNRQTGTKAHRKQQHASFENENAIKTCSVNQIGTNPRCKIIRKI
jgi:hypothetical protein